MTHAVAVALALVLLAGETGGYTTPPSIGAGAADGVIDVDGQLSVPEKAGRGGGARSGAPRTVYLYLPACEGNDPNAPQRASVGCAAAQQMCAGTPAPDDLMFWRFSAVRSPDGSTTPWADAGATCLRFEDVPAAPVPAFTLADFRRLPLPPATLHVQPANGRTLVNVPTNLYAAGGPRTFDVTLLGVPVRVRATPVAWTWSYGDGTQRTLDTPGAPYPDLSTAYTFTQPGDVTVRLTTTWTGTYSVAGGPSLPVDGTATVTSPQADLTVVETRAELVAETRP